MADEMIGLGTKVVFTETGEAIADVAMVTVFVLPNEPITAEVVTVKKGENSVLRFTSTYEVAAVSLSPDGEKIIKVYGAKPLEKFVMEGTVVCGNLLTPEEIAPALRNQIDAIFRSNEPQNAVPPL